jgi:DNA-binding NtrC family response regulator
MRCSVLIADDEELLRDSIAELLRADGYLCQCAADGLAAQQTLLKQRFDVLVADIQMAGNQDLELVQWAATYAPGMPIILMTGNPTVDSAVAGLRFSVAAYLVKPVDYDRLRACLNEVTQQHHARLQLAEVSQHLSHCVEAIQGALATTASATAPTAKPLVSNLLLRTLAACLSQLLELRHSLSPQEKIELLCSRIDCPHYASHRNMLVETVEVLKKTKNSFHSKELAKLRVSLENGLR